FSLHVDHLDLHSFPTRRSSDLIALGRNALRALLLYIDRYRQNRDTLLAVGNPNEDHVFLSEGGFALTRRGIDMLFQRLRRRVDLPNGMRISPQFFRHTFAVRYLMRNC